MLAFVIKRVLATIPVMTLVAFFVFSLLYLAPGDPAVILAGDQATPEDVERIRVSLGLDQPYLVRFFEWAWGVVRGDLGTSIFTAQPVADMIVQRIEPTLSLMLVTLSLSIVVAVPIGVMAAWTRGQAFDRIAMGLSVLIFSIPVFVIGYLLAYLMSVKLGWLPVQGYAPLSTGFLPWIRSLILPSVTIGLVYVALVARISRATMIEVLQQDYIRTAKAKGVSDRGILFLHALKNASIPIVTVIGLGMTLLISGSVVTETVFSIPGLGRLTVDSILRRDFPVIQGLVLVFSFVYVLVNLLVDLAYTLLDPRIRY